MYRYHLIASFDTALHEVKSEIDTVTSTVIATIPMLDNKGMFRYGVRTALNKLSRHNIYPSECGIDAIVIGLLVYIADVKISRVKQSQDSWSREIVLTVPVMDERWFNSRLTLERMLKFLTGDIWHISFIQREIELAQKDKFDEKNDKYEAASLFSGGMDSLIGAINLMEKKQPTLLVSHAAETRVRNWQTGLLSLLDKYYEDVPHDNAYLWTRLSSIKLPETENEKSQRSRSFLFITIALLAMSGMKNCKKLFMPENGLIALNVPLDSLRIGSHSTRTTHPYYLTLWNEIAGNLFGVVISNPYWNKTKGEMAAECINKALLKNAVVHSYSCSSVNNACIRSRVAQHCGHCLPCIIRRAALHKAFPNQDPTSYMYGSVVKLVKNRGAVGEQLRSFQYAINRLKNNIFSKNALIHKPGPLTNDTDYLVELANVYERGLLEVDRWIQDSLEQEHDD